jgi:hypothetical protein
VIKVADLYYMRAYNSRVEGKGKDRRRGKKEGDVEVTKGYYQREGS